jgi:hypothetical protein
LCRRAFGLSVLAVEEGANHDGSIDVAVEEVDEHLGAHAMGDVAALVVMRDRTRR